MPTAPTDDERAYRYVVATFASIRTARGLTPHALAQAAGITPQEVERVESGAPDIHISVLHRYARALGGRIYFEIGREHDLPEM